MKIGILTYHRAENYGALLQAYALRTYLQSLGHEVEFVDYWPDYHEDFFRIFPVRKFKSGNIITKMVCIYMATVWGNARRKRKLNLQRFMREQLGLPNKPKYRSASDVCDEFDVVFYGSDQIWRKQNLTGHQGYDFWYFGSDNVRARKISYAASMGVMNTSSQDDVQIQRYLSGFDSLSVRESSLKDYLEKIGLSSIVVSDPVFLLGAEKWRHLYEKVVPKSQNKYILYYNLLNNAQSTIFANKLSRNTGLPIIEITKKYSISQMGKRYHRHDSVQEFLSLIDNAEYVVSNSFHGVAFSLIFNKQFYAVGMGERAGRVISLLSSIGISERYVKEGFLALEKLDYKMISGCLEPLIVKSRQFVNNVIKDVEK